MGVIWHVEPNIEPLALDIGGTSRKLSGERLLEVHVLNFAIYIPFPPPSTISSLLFYHMNIATSGTHPCCSLAIHRTGLSAKIALTYIY